MKYNDRFLRALGAWQNWWEEDKERRLLITDELLAAIEDLHPFTLPVMSPLPRCFRKRYLVPDNPQNNGEMVKLVLLGRIDEGPASWTSEVGFAQNFKELVRSGCITAIIEHTPHLSEVLVDFPTLWQDPDFRVAVRRYVDNGGKYSEALSTFRSDQYELILDAPLLRNEAVDFVGAVRPLNVFYSALGATTPEAEDAVWAGLVNMDIFPGDLRWVGRTGAQRALDRVREKYERRVAVRRWVRQYRQFLFSHTALTPCSTAALL